MSDDVMKAAREAIAACGGPDGARAQAEFIGEHRSPQLAALVLAGIEAATADHLVRAQIEAIESGPANKAAEAPSDAEIASWLAVFNDAMLAMNHAWMMPDSPSCKPFGEHSKHAAVREAMIAAVDLMRRARQPQPQPDRAVEALRGLVEACDDDRRSRASLDYASKCMADAAVIDALRAAKEVLRG